MRITSLRTLLVPMLAGIAGCDSLPSPPAGVAPVQEESVLVSLPTPQCQGTAVQGGVLVCHAPPEVATVMLEGQPVKLGMHGAFLLGFGRDSAAQVTLTVVGKDGRRRDEIHNVAPRVFNIERINGLPREAATASPEQVARRAAEVAQINAARADVSAGEAWRTPWIWPTVGRVSGVFGSQRILNGVPRAPHGGIDIANKIGTPIVAPQAGVVRLAVTGLSLEGGIVVIDHGHGLSSQMIHLSRLDVRAGDAVAQGQVIGAMGKTGRATGSHLHWGVTWTRLNPAPSDGSPTLVRLDPQLLPGLSPLPPKAAD